MKIALCHLELSCGPQERNLQILEQAVRIAAEQGADWVLTPEVAVQGYYFYRIDENAVVVPQPSLELEPLRKLCCEYGITLFLGCGEYDAACDKNFNSCLVFGPDGELIGRHRKVLASAWEQRPGRARVTVLPCFPAAVCRQVCWCAQICGSQNITRGRRRRVPKLLSTLLPGRRRRCVAIHCPLGCMHLR